MVFKSVLSPAKQNRWRSTKGIFVSRKGDNLYFSFFTDVQKVTGFKKGIVVDFQIDFDRRLGMFITNQENGRTLQQMKKSSTLRLVISKLDKKVLSLFKIDMYTQLEIAEMKKGQVIFKLP